MNVPRILIVDDEAAVRESYLTILQPFPAFTELDNIAASLFDDEESEESADDEDWFGEDVGEVSEGEFDTIRYDIHEASQGQQAVQMVGSALNANQPFSLIFLDMRMPPGMSGMETAKAIREMDANVEIVIMTAYSDYSYEQIVKEVGNPERLLYFHKPFRADQIRQLALSLTQRWTIDNQMRFQTLN